MPADRRDVFHSHYLSQSSRILTIFLTMYLIKYSLDVRRARFPLHIKEKLCAALRQCANPGCPAGPRGRPRSSERDPSSRRSSSGTETRPTSGGSRQVDLIGDDLSAGVALNQVPAISLTASRPLSSSHLLPLRRATFPQLSYGLLAFTPLRPSVLRRE